jgi:hypothetical protein
VFGGLNRLLLAAVVAGAVLVAPTAASASGCSGGPSAENVYSECLPSGGGSKPTNGGKAGTSSAQQPIPISKQLRRKLAHAKIDHNLLYQLVTNPGYGATRGVPSTGVTAASAPSALGSAFDLGSGPTALLAVLAGTAVLLLAASGVRGWRHWRR